MKEYNESGLPIVSKEEANFFNSMYRGEFANSNLNEAIKLLRDWDEFKETQKWESIKSQAISFSKGEIH